MGLRITMPQAPAFLRTLGTLRQQIKNGVRDVSLRAAEQALKRVKELTPADTGETRDKWRLFVINKAGPSGKAQGAFFAAIDHPYNEAGATRTVTNDFGEQVTQVVNRGDGTGLLTDLEFGTTAHTITPRSPKQFLRFKIGGKTVFTRKVAHPGTRAYNMTRIAAAEAQRDVSRGLDMVLARAIATLESIR